MQGQSKGSRGNDAHKRDNTEGAPPKSSTVPPDLGLAVRRSAYAGGGDGPLVARSQTTAEARRV